jgi:putative tryptophan/tyrosine transport system substrate-binding protein
MKRRDFIALLGSSLAWPVAAHAQHPQGTRLVGVQMGFAVSDPTAQSMVAALRGALQKLGWTEGGNLRIELRWGGYDRDRIKMLAKELVERQPDAIFGQTTPVISALAAETRTIPIVFVTVSDPVRSGFAANLAHPGGNITGFTVDNPALGGKWVQLLKEVAPGINRVALLYNPNGPSLDFFLPSIQAAASSSAIEVRVATVGTKEEIEGVIASQAHDPIGGLIVMPSAFNSTNRELTSALAERYRVPAIYFASYFAQSGGLIAYGTDYAEQSRQAAGYIDAILKGTKPADLPVQAPTKFELVINLKTAKAMGITVPPLLLARADEVIE